MQYPLRSTVEDFLYSFRRYGRGRQFYVNLAVRDVPDWVRTAPIDAVIYHTSFFSQRWSPGQFEKLFETAAPLKGVGRVRVGLPQDEFTRTEPLSRFVDEFELDHVFTLASESAARKIYAGLDLDRVGFTRAQPGYLSGHTQKRIERIVARTQQRPIDLSYRAWSGAPWLGRHGMLKGEIADVVGKAAEGRPIRTDISNRDEDTFHGDDWFRFLASSKYVLGCEGGASLQDPDGSIRERTERYQAEHPGASFEEIEAACFPGQDGNLDYFAIGPRHIEACATRTCQVLVEGEYSGVLRPHEHYIELKRDYSNLDEVLELVERDEVREEITETAYRDVIASGRYTYESFVREVEDVIAVHVRQEGRRSAAMVLRQPWENAVDRASWAAVVYRLRYWHRLHVLRHRWLIFRQRRLAPYAPRNLLAAILRRLSRRG